MKATLVVDALVTAPTAVAPPSRNTRYVIDVARSSVDAGHVRSICPARTEVPVGTPGVVGGAVSGFWDTGCGHAVPTQTMSAWSCALMSAYGGSLPGLASPSRFVSCHGSFARS